MTARLLAGENVELSIRPARDTDATSIAELLNPIIEAGTYTILDERISVADQLDFIRELPERAIYHVAICERTQQVLGVQDVLPESSGPGALGHVGAISTFVSLASHRNGIGRSLCRATVRAARNNGFRKLSATIRADNRQAVSFYVSQGFRVVGTAHKHALVRGRHIDEVLMERLID